MKKIILAFFIFVPLFFVTQKLQKTDTSTGAPPYTEDDLEPPDDKYFSDFQNWTRPQGPTKVGLQVGHWKNNEFPDELERLRGNTGSSGGGKWEWEVNLEIVTLTKELLEQQGIVVDILPATVPPRYLADAFVAVHADGSTDKTKSGFKVASPRRDYTRKATQLVSHIESEYEKATNLELDPNVTRNMRGYYAFAWWRYEHSVHPMTPSAILETGFLTNLSDRKTIVSNPDISAKGLAEGIINFLQSNSLLPDA